MTAEEIRNVDMHGESEAVRQEFALAMIQETAAQLAELNARVGYRQVPELRPVEELSESIRRYGSVVPYLYPQRPAMTRRA